MAATAPAIKQIIPTATMFHSPFYLLRVVFSAAASVVSSAAASVVSSAAARILSAVISGGSFTCASCSCSASSSSVLFRAA